MRCWLAAVIYTWLSIATAAPNCYAAPLELFVAPNGHDGNRGDVRHPLRTLVAARDEIRAWKRKHGDLPAEGVRVWIRAGEYTVNETVFFEAEDSGTSTKPIMYAAYPHENVVLTGGRELQFSRKELPELARLHPEVRRQVVVASGRVQGLTELGGFQPRSALRPMFPAPTELFCEGNRLEWARWPNQQSQPLQLADREGELRVPPLLLNACRAAGEIWLQGNWLAQGATSWEAAVCSPVDADALCLRSTLAPKPRLTEGQTYVAFNALELLDRPGEWCVDRTRDTLYLWPPRPLNACRIIASHTPTLLCCDNAAHLHFRDLKFAHARVCAVEILDGASIKLENCHIEHMGNLGVTIQGGWRHSVRHCVFQDLGDGAVRVDGGNQERSEAAGHDVHGCTFSDWQASGLSHRAAIYLCGHGQEVSANHFHSAGACIYSFGTGHKIDAWHLVANP